MNSIPQNKWWSIPAFIRAIKEKFPDYQRPAGDYDSWFIKRKSDGQYLRGFAYWDQVDGALIKYFIQTLHWLGMADLASPEEGKEATAFRVVSLKSKSKVNFDFEMTEKSQSLPMGKSSFPDYFPCRALSNLAFL